jgi:hypothetical protein
VCASIISRTATPRAQSKYSRRERESSLTWRYYACGTCLRGVKMLLMTSHPSGSITSR